MGCVAGGREHAEEELHKGSLEVQGQEAKVAAVDGGDLQGDKVIDTNSRDDDQDRDTNRQDDDQVIDTNSQNDDQKDTKNQQARR